MGANDLDIVSWDSADWTPGPIVQHEQNESDANNTGDWDSSSPVLTPEERRRWYGLSKEEIKAEEQAKKDWDNKRGERDAEWMRQKAAMKPTRLLSTIEDVREILPVLEACKGDTPRAVVDTEGFNTYRCECDIIEIYSCVEQQLYMFDTFTLGADMFDISTDTGFSLRTFLTSPEIPKIFWDVRQDANALWCSVDITLAGVIDASLLLTRMNLRNIPDANHRVGLDSAIAEYLLKNRLISELEYDDLDQGKRGRMRLAKPEVWTIRPLPECLIEYSRDVRLIAMLCEQWIMPHFRSERQIVQLQETLKLTQKEVALACSAGYSRDGANSTGTPWSTGDKCTIWSDFRPDKELQEFLDRAIAARRSQGWRQDLSRYERPTQHEVSTQSVLNSFRTPWNCVMNLWGRIRDLYDRLVDNLGQP